MLYWKEDGVAKDWNDWCVGEPFPHVYSDSVLVFQADGDELDVILAALRAPRTST